MKKLVNKILSSFIRGRAVGGGAVVVRPVTTPEQIIAKLKMLNTGYLPETFLPATKRVRCLGFKLEEIARQAGEAERDIVSAFNRGEDLHGRVADLQTVFRHYEKCFSELSLENYTLAQASKIYAEELQPLINP